MGKQSGLEVKGYLVARVIVGHLVFLFRASEVEREKCVCLILTRTGFEPVTSGLKNRSILYIKIYLVTFPCGLSVTLACDLWII